MKVLWLEHARIGNWLTKNPWRRVYKFLSRWTTVVVTSNAMQPILAPLVKNVFAIPCAVVINKTEPLPKDIVDFLKGGFAVGTVARLTVDKGVDRIVRLVHSKPDMRLIIIGDGPLRAEIEKKAKAGQVMLLPSLPRGQLMALYEALDLFILASTEMDPFGMVAAEAMWFGTPVLLTNKCGIATDLMDGRDAVIVDAKFAEMDKAVKRLMRRPELRKKLGEHGKKFVREHYMLREMVSGFEGQL